MIISKKNYIRQHILHERNNLCNQQKLIVELIGQFNHYALPLIKSQDVIAGYYPSGSEANILPILTQLQNQLLLPVISKSPLTIKFYPWHHSEALFPSKYASNILEPIHDKQDYYPSIIIAPLIACDLFGNRIGSGKGIYDRAVSYLRSINPNLLYIGICYDLQLLNSIPAEKHDQKLDIIITNKRFINTLLLH